MSKPLTFGELTVNEKFIGFPIDGDDKGHGGYRNEHYIFVVLSRMWSEYNAMRLLDGQLSRMPDTMQVLRVS